ncbi:MAG: lipopolysaccharide biosynthesis protein [Henriciella sp.]|nr:lipopolysaccharide biosynthesis protein [Hyphomonadaceae bacterium]
MKLLRHLAGYLPVNIASGIAAFGGVYVYTRLLGPEDYGRYALMFSVMSLVHMLSLTSAEAAAFRFAGEAREQQKLPDHFRTTLSLTMRSLILAAILIGALAISLGRLPEYLKILPWLALLIPMNSLIQMALEAHRATENVGRYVLIASSKTLGGFVFGALIAWQTGFGAASPFIGMILAGSIWVVTETRWMVGQARTGTTNATRRRAYLFYGAPIAAALVLDLILSVADRFLIAVFLGEAAVGEYAAGYGVADKSVLLICAWAAMAAMPLVMAAYERGGAVAAAEESRGLIRTLLLIGVPAAAGLALVATPLSEALIGEAVREGARQIIPWIAFAGLLNGLTIHYYSEVFHLAHRTGELALLMLVPAVANIALNLILIPPLGLLGAVLATLLSYAISIGVLALAGRRLIALPMPLADLFKICVAAAAMAPVIWLIPAWGSWPELIVKVAVGAGVYGLMAFLLDAGGARGFVSERLTSRGHASA